jgi:hypothetical protein
VGVHPGDFSENGGWPSTIWDDALDDASEGAEFDVYDFVAGHLADGEVAILMSCGAEKLRYLTGAAEAPQLH